MGACSSFIKRGNGFYINILIIRLKNNFNDSMGINKIVTSKTCSCYQCSGH